MVVDVSYRQEPKRLSKLPVGTVGAAPLIVVVAGAVDAVWVCVVAGCAAGSLFGWAAGLAFAVCLAGRSFLSVGLVLDAVCLVGAGLAFGAGAAFSGVPEPPSPTMRAMRAIMLPPDDDSLLGGELLVEGLLEEGALPLDENRLLNMLVQPDEG